MEKLILADNTEIQILDGASLGNISAEVADWTAAGALVDKLTDENLKKVRFGSGEDASGEYTDMTLITPVQVTPGSPALLTFGIRERTDEEIQQADVQTAISYLSDEQALTVKDLYADWNENGMEYIAGDRVRYDGKLYKCLQGHTSQADWSPEAAPSLWAEILAGQEGTEIGEWVQPESTNPYSKGDKVTHNGKTWESLIDGNVWEPGAQGSESLWKEVIE